MVDLDVALTVRVTERPKKLKPLLKLVFNVDIQFIIQHKATYPILNIIIRLEIPIDLYVVICLHPSIISK